MINLLLAPIYKIISMAQRTISLAIANWPITLIALTLGVSVEEIWYGFRILNWLALI